MGGLTNARAAYFRKKPRKPLDFARGICYYDTAAYCGQESSRLRGSPGNSESIEKAGRNMFAVIETGGKQYKVQYGDVIYVEKLNAAENVPVCTDIGGVAGYSSGIIQSCTNSGSVGYDHVGTTSAASWGGSPDIWTAVPTPATFWAGRTWAASPVSWSRKCGCSMTRADGGAAGCPGRSGDLLDQTQQDLRALPTLCRTGWTPSPPGRTRPGSSGRSGGLRRGLDQREYRGAQQPHGPDLLAHRPAGADPG